MYGKYVLHGERRVVMYREGVLHGANCAIHATQLQLPVHVNPIPPSQPSVHPSSHSSLPLPLIELRRLLQDRTDHLVADPGGFGEAGREVGLGAFETVAVAGEIAEGDAVGPALFVPAGVRLALVLVSGVREGKGEKGEVAGPTEADRKREGEKEETEIDGKRGVRVWEESKVGANNGA